MSISLYIGNMAVIPGIVLLGFSIEHVDDDVSIPNFGASLALLDIPHYMKKGVGTWELRD